MQNSDMINNEVLDQLNFELFHKQKVFKIDKWEIGTSRVLMCYGYFKPFNKNIQHGHEYSTFLTRKKKILKIICYLFQSHKNNPDSFG